MKNYDEIANAVFERRDAYVARQRQKRRTVMKITSAVGAVALVALLGLGFAGTGWLDPATPAVENPPTTEPTATPTEDNGPGVGGDNNECEVHSARYHRISGKLIKRGYPIEPYLAACQEAGVSTNIVGYVEYYNITRETFIEAMGWDALDLDEKKDEQEGRRYCPYTYNQFLDAIYGDDEELTAWVFAPEDTWPEIESAEEPVAEEPAE